MKKAKKMQARKFILIIENVEADRVVLRRILEGAYRIAESKSSIEGVRYIEQHHDEIAMVLLNIHILKIDGFNVMKFMQKNGYIKDIPVILIIEDEDAAMIEQGYRLGAVDIIRKPFGQTVVCRRVENVMAVYRQQAFREQSAWQTAEIAWRNDKLDKHNENILDLLMEILISRNVETAQHIQNVKQYTEILARQYALLYPRSRMTEKKIGYIVKAAGIHDLGKIWMPDILMQRKGNLLPEEEAYLEEHTIRGGEIIDVMSGFQKGELYRISGNVCRCHHEKYDGSGYPRGLSGDRIPIEAQIVALADVYDTLVRVMETSGKIYSRNRLVQMLLDGGCGELAPRMKECLAAARREFGGT